MAAEPKPIAGVEAAAERSPAVRLPAPVKDRWHPLRSGLLNLYRYDYEVFPFEQGRLLLRGHNGTGKSRVLALQLPFLLDGEIAPHRVEPDGDSAKRMEWNLLMGRYDERLGYSWIEFGRRLPDGGSAFLTLGCGLRAVEGRTGVARWFFITSQRVGADLRLKTHDGRPLTRDQLEMALGLSGRIIERVEEWRHAVDQALFRLGPRYEALIELLIRLRQPQLSRKLDEKALSGALSEALPPLPYAVIDDVAEAFRSLESDRQEVQTFSAVRRAVGAFLEDYRRYLRTAIRRRAAAVRSTHAAYEEAQRQLRSAERTKSEQEETQRQANGEIACLDRELAAAEAAIRALEDSPEMRSLRELQRAREEEAERRLNAEHAREDLTAAEAAAADAAQALQEREATVAEQARAARQRAASTARCASEADLAAEHGTIFTEELGDIPPATDWMETLRSRWESVLEARERAIAHLRARNGEVHDAAQQHAIALTRLREAEAAEGRALEDEAQAREKLTAARGELLSRYSAWHRALVHLRCPSAEEIADDLIAWADQRSGASPLDSAADEALRKAQGNIANERAAAEQRDGNLALELETVEAERYELERGGQPLPHPPPWRTASREGRQGLPLWRTCDFRTETPPEIRAGLEAALDASGLLDAWLLPDGTLLDPKTEDAFLVAVPEHPPLAEERTLAQWLEPSLRPEQVAATGLGPETVARVLLRIGNEPEASTHWAAADGSWQLGPLRGRAYKAEAEFIGENARAAARRRRLAELAARRDELLAARREIAQQLTSLRVAEIATLEERRRLPDHEALRAAGAAIDTAVTAVQRAAEARRAAAFRQTEAKERHDAAIRRRDQDAADLRLTTWVNRLDQLGGATNAYRVALAAIEPTIRAWQIAWQALNEARQRAGQTQSMLTSRALRHAEISRLYDEARARVATLAGALGASESELLEHLKNEKVRKETLASSLEQARRSEREAYARAAAAERDVQRFAAERDQHGAARQAAITHLRTLAAHGLLREAEPALPPTPVDDDAWSATFSVEFARTLNERLHDAALTNEAWQRQQQDVFQHVDTLRDALIPHGYHPDATPVDDGLVLVRCPFRGKLCAMSEFEAVLGEDLSLRQRLLDEREREVIENHLLGEAAAELQRLIRDAERWVEHTNREITARPTSTGMQLKFVWEVDPDGPPGLDAARRHLLRANALWTPEDRTALASFLQERIRAERNVNESGTWRDQLAAALDYRRWHRFAILRQQDGQWRRLTRATYGTGSGGEKALALTIPQFAAAAAHYASADPNAPRLILLDEVFVGIDSDMRSKCMGLLATFDLDFVMTSEREWGCYPTLPGLAICQLTSRPGIDAVLVTPWVWNGEELREMARPELPASTPSAAATT